MCVSIHVSTLTRFPFFLKSLLYMGSMNSCSADGQHHKCHVIYSLQLALAEHLMDVSTIKRFYDISPCEKLYCLQLLDFLWERRVLFSTLSLIMYAG